MTREEREQFVRNVIDTINFDDVRHTGFDAQVGKIVDRWEEDADQIWDRGADAGRDGYVPSD